MLCVPKAAEPLLLPFSVAFTSRTFQRVLILIMGMILALRRRTVTALLEVVGSLSQGHWSDFHRVLSCRAWSCFRLGKVLCALVLELIPADQPVVIPVDDTAIARNGKHVFGQGKHLDPVRSTHRFKAWLWGHRWVVLGINVKFPFAAAPWALPVLCVLYRKEQDNCRARRRHKTATRLAMQLVATLIHWFPQRKFILLGDGGYSSHELAKFCHRHRRHVTLVSRCHAWARLYDPPPVRRKGRGRRALHGKQRPAPAQVVNTSKPRRATVSWYGGKKRKVGLVGGTGLWYHAGGGMAVPIRWVFVHDLTGTHRDEYLYSTDPTLSEDQIVSLFTARWCIEVTFQESRAHLGLTTLRNWSRNSVLRSVPCLLGLFSLVSLIFAAMDRHQAIRPANTPWYLKQQCTFSDAITSVRRACWAGIFSHLPAYAAVKKIPPQFRHALLDQLSRAP